MPVGLLRDTIGGLIFTDVYMGTYYWSGSITTVRITLFEQRQRDSFFCHAIKIESSA